jgi:hypothetical protein
MAEQNESTPQQGATRDGDVVSQVSALLDAEVNDMPIKQEAKPDKKVPKSKQDLETELPPIDESNEEDEGEEEHNEDEPQEPDEIEEGDLTWAKALGIDEKQLVLDDDGEFAGVKVKVDGKISIVKLPDLIASYQSNKSNTLKSQTLAEDRKQLDEKRVSLLQEYSKKIKDAEALTSYLETSMTEEYQGIDWQSLRYSNPAEYAAMVQDYNLKTAHIKQIKDAILEVNNEENQKFVGESQQKTQQFIQGQVEKAIENNPAWNDAKVMRKALVEMQNFIGEAYGFTSEEFADIKDARILELIKDAHKYRSGVKIADKKLEKKVAKYQKPIGTSTKKISKLEQLKKAAKQTTGYAQRDAQRDAVTELLFGGSD